MAALEPATVPTLAEAVADHRFAFINVERRLRSIDWSATYESPLWTFQLHYFDFAVDLAQAWRSTGESRYGDRYVELWSSWLAAATRGDVRLKPYPTSIRCLNALRSLWLVEERIPAEFVERLLGAVHAQLVWLSGHIERHLGANHLLKNLAALAWGSLAFGDPVALGWRRYLEEFWHQLDEQVLPDGVHIERSPMYHADVLADALRTLAVSRAADVETPPEVPRRLRDMARALKYLSRPDGSLHLFNDAANAQRPARREVLGLAEEVVGAESEEPAGTFRLPHGGYFGVIDPHGAHRLVVDAGPLGPSYQPGHAHCDMLSFELDVGGCPVVVDSGVHGYDGDPYRAYSRSTRAHNTVEIDGRDQHEMWATFRVAGRGELIEVDCGAPDAADFELHASCRHFHDRSALVNRDMELLDSRLTITDSVDGASGRSLASWLHLHPEQRVERAGSGFLASRPGGEGPTVRIEPFGIDESLVHYGEVNPLRAWYFPEFGVALPAPTIEFRVRENDGRRFGYHVFLFPKE